MKQLFFLTLVVVSFSSSAQAAFADVNSTIETAAIFISTSGDQSTITKEAPTNLQNDLEAAQLTANNDQIHKISYLLTRLGELKPDTTSLDGDLNSGGSGY